MYTLYKITSAATGITYRAKDTYPSISRAIGAATLYGWGSYQVNDSDGRKVASVRLAPPLVSESLPIELTPQAIAERLASAA